MRCLWRKAPATARDVCDGLETGWAYTTVRTFLARLAEKGAVRVRRKGSAALYAPALTQAQARRAAVRALATRAFDGAVGPMVHFLVGRLSAKERAEVRRLLLENDR